VFNAALDRDLDSAMVAAARSGREDWITEVVEARGLHDPGETIEWLDALETEWETVAAAWRTAYQNWVREDPPGSSAWVAELPDSPQRDAGISALIDDLVTDSPDQDYGAAIAWAQVASERPVATFDRWPEDEVALPTRVNLLRGIMRSWSYDLETDAERSEARAAFRGISDLLDDQTRAELERALNPHQDPFAP
jgi:hypothetical protein